MAKKDKNEKAKAPKLPKRIAGVKLPKDVRRKGGALLAKANSPAGREMIAAGLSIAAVAAASRTRRGAKAAETVAEGAGSAAKAGAHDARVLADAVGSIAASALERLFAGKAKG